MKTCERKWEILLLVLLLAGTSILAFRSICPGMRWWGGDDYALYVQQARGLAEGRVREAIELNEFNVRHSTGFAGPVAGPWGYPVLLSGIYAVFGLDFYAMRVLNVAIFLLALAAVFIAARRFLSVAAALMLTALLGSNLYLLQFLNNIVTDVLYLFFVVLVLDCIGRSVVDHEPRLDSLRGRVLLGGLIFLASFVREEGASLLLVLLCAQIVESTRRAGRSLRGWREVGVTAAPYVTFALVALAQSRWLRFGDGAHFNLLWYSLTHAAHWKRNLLAHFEAPSEFFGGAFPEIAYGFTIPLACRGVWLSFRRSYPIVLFCALLLAGTTIWMPIQGCRFLIPALPFYLLFVLLGFARGDATTVENSEGRTALHRVAMSGWGRAWALVMILMFARRSWREGPEFWRESPYGTCEPSAQAMFRYVKEETAPASIVSCHLPRLLALMTRRRALKVDDPAGLTACDYLVLSEFDAAYTRCLFGDSQGPPATSTAFRCVFSNEAFRIYQVLHE